MIEEQEGVTAIVTTHHALTVSLYVGIVMAVVMKVVNMKHHGLNVTTSAPLSTAGSGLTSRRAQAVSNAVAPHLVQLASISRLVSAPEIEMLIAYPARIRGR